MASRHPFPGRNPYELSRKFASKIGSRTILTAPWITDLLRDPIQEKHPVVIFQGPLVEPVDQRREILNRSRDGLGAHPSSQEQLENLAGPPGTTAGQEDLAEQPIHPLPEPAVAIEHAKAQRGGPGFGNLEFITPFRRNQRPPPISRPVIEPLKGPLVGIGPELPIGFDPQYLIYT